MSDKDDKDLTQLDLASLAEHFLKKYGTEQRATEAFTDFVKPHPHLRQKAIEVGVRDALVEVAAEDRRKGMKLVVGGREVERSRGQQEEQIAEQREEAKMSHVNVSIQRSTRNEI